MILADGALGQMMEPVDFEEKKHREIPEKTWACTGTKGGRPHNIVNSLIIEPNELESVLEERYKRYAEIEEKEVMYEEFMTDDAEIIVTAFGITARIARTAVTAAREKGIKAGLFRPITLWPFPSKRLRELADKADRFLCVEMNKGQMVDDVKLATECRKPVDFYGRTGGIVPDAGGNPRRDWRSSQAKERNDGR